MDKARRSLTGVKKHQIRGPANRAEAEQIQSRRAAEREKRLVELAQAGDQGALEVLYREHYDQIFRYCLFRLGSAAAAEDVTSQVFLAMVRGLARFSWQGRPFVAWLYAVAKKQVAYYLRSAAKVDPMPEQDGLTLMAESAAPDPSPASSLEAQERRLALLQALKSLPEAQREVLVLRYLLSFSLEEAAAALGRSEGAIKQLQLRALAALRAQLGSPEGWF